MTVALAVAEPPPKVASSEIVRDINRRAVLNLIRTGQPISRADLARASGLQRSTISLIVEQLIEENWVLAGPTGKLPRGRRPTYLRLNEERVIIGVDVRPAETTIVLSDVNGSFASREVIATPRDSKAALRELIRAIRRMTALGRGKKIEGIGICLPGRFDENFGPPGFRTQPELGRRGGCSQSAGAGYRIRRRA